ncbi:MAG TPA: trigger factor [Gemmatimonadales bacterium]|nr:trigger factor [Gemmatimonadales bacterium]
MTETGIAITAAAQDAARRTYAVSVSPERVRAAEAATTERYARQLKVQGFRKGKAPASVVRRRFGDAIRQSVIEELLRASWETARDQDGLKPIADPQVRNVKFEDGAPLTFELLVDVKPEIALERLGGFRLTRRQAAVTDEMVDAQLTSLREQRAPWVPVAERAKPGDLVEATITNLDEPPAATEGGPAPEPVRFVLGQGRALPELETHLMELDPGGAWEGTVRFPDDHPDAAKRGQSRRVRATLGEVKRQHLPDLTDEFAREVGEFDSVEALRAGVRTDLEAEARREAEARVRGELIDQIAAANNVAVPPSLLDRALAAYVAAYGIPEDQRARFAGEFRPVAEAGVRRDLIIETVAERKGLAASDDAVASRVADVARRRGETPAAVRAALEKAGRLRELERSITEENVFTFLLGQSAVEDAPPTR